MPRVWTCVCTARLHLNQPPSVRLTTAALSIKPGKTQTTTLSPSQNTSPNCMTKNQFIINAPNFSHFSRSHIEPAIREALSIFLLRSINTEESRSHISMIRRTSAELLVGWRDNRNTSSYLPIHPPHTINLLSWTLLLLLFTSLSTSDTQRFMRILKLTYLNIFKQHTLTERGT